MYEVMCVQILMVLAMVKDLEPVWPAFLVCLWYCIQYFCLVGVVFVLSYMQTVVYEKLFINSTAVSFINRTTGWLWKQATVYTNSVVGRGKRIDFILCDGQLGTFPVPVDRLSIHSTIRKTPLSAEAKLSRGASP